MMKEPAERDLTGREEEILDLVAKGVSTKAIAERLWITVNTVRNHIYSIMTKLGVNSRIAAVAAWRERRTDVAGRILAYCRRSGFRLTDLQVALIRAAISAEVVQCRDGQHVFPPSRHGEHVKCLCGTLKVDP